MIAGDRRIPVGGAAAFGQEDLRGGLSVLFGVERVVERAEDTCVIGDVDLEAADIDVRETADHDREDSGDGIAFGLVVGAAAGGVDGPWPGCPAGSAGAAALDSTDGGKDAGWDVPIPLGFGGCDIARRVGRGGTTRCRAEKKG